jgi:hypothetical protein
MKQYNDYKIEWHIEVNATSPEDAALQARDMMLDPESTATIFKVIAENNTMYSIDTEGGVAVVY